MLACWLLPFVVFTLRLFKRSLNLKIATFKALSLCDLNIRSHGWHTVSLWTLGTILSGWMGEFRRSAEKAEMAKGTVAVSWILV